MTIKIEYFSDVLCIWAYGGQIRLDELKREFADDIDIEYRFVSIFGAGRQHVENAWKDQGGVEGFNKHLKQVAKNWPHVKTSADLWVKVSPESSISAHLYLKAIQLLAQQGAIDNSVLESANGRTLFEEAIWLFRDAFFREGLDVARRSVQEQIAEKLNLPIASISELLDSGKAHAALYQDDVAKNNYNIPGSPTLVLNEGRQILYGNVGYRIIGANVRELLHNPEQNDASWC